METTDKFLIEFKFLKKVSIVLFGFKFFLNLRTIFFRFYVYAACVLIVSMVHKGPLASDTVAEWSPSSVLDLFLILAINLTFAIGHR